MTQRPLDILCESWRQSKTDEHVPKVLHVYRQAFSPSRLHQPIIGLTAARSLLIGRNAATPVAAFHAFPEGLTHGRILLALHLKSRTMTMCLALELESWVVVIFYRCLVVQAIVSNLFHIVPFLRGIQTLIPAPRLPRRRSRVASS